MEKRKTKYLKAFLDRTSVKLENFVKLIKDWEERVHNCYEESIKLGRGEVVKMVSVDSSFMIELPLFVLEGLFNLAFESNKQNSDCSSFLELSMSYLKGFSLTKQDPDL
ncbi:hypothetical protein ACSBR2_040233 [Camellia fascicularis]